MKSGSGCEKRSVRLHQMKLVKDNECTGNGCGVNVV
jgi:hypothetical protein